MPGALFREVVPGHAMEFRVERLDQLLECRGIPSPPGGKQGGNVGGPRRRRTPGHYGHQAGILPKNDRLRTGPGSGLPLSERAAAHRLALLNGETTVSGKRSLALREFAPGVEGLERFAQRSRSDAFTSVFSASWPLRANRLIRVYRNRSDTTLRGCGGGDGARASISPLFGEYPDRPSERSPPLLERGPCAYLASSNTRRPARWQEASLNCLASQRCQSRHG